MNSIPDAPPLPAAAQALRDFACNGFCLLPHVMTPAQLAAAACGVDWLMAHGPDNYKWIKQWTYECYREHPVFVELLEHPLVIAFAGGLIGGDFHVIAAQCSRNTRDDPYSAFAMKLHRDEVFFCPAAVDAGPQPYRGSFSAMWYVQDTPLEMGPTELISGSHVGGVKFSDETLDPALLWRQAVPAGSLLLFSHHTCHRGAPNRTDRPRDLITNAYARREIPKAQLTKRSADGTYAYVPCAELLASGSPMIQQLLRP